MKKTAGLSILIASIIFFSCTSSHHITSPVIKKDTRVDKDSLTLEHHAEDDNGTPRHLKLPHPTPPPPPPESVVRENLTIVRQPNLRKSGNPGSGSGNENSDVKFKTESRKSKKNKVDPPSTTQPPGETKKFDRGDLLNDIPDTMGYRKSYTIHLRINRNTSDKSISNNMNNSKKSVIKTSDLMEVRIVDPSPDDNKSFLIVKNNKDQQAVDTTDYTEWVYDITPVKTGKLNLHMVVSIVRNGISKEQVYMNDIYVSSNLGKVVIHDTQTFFNKNWQWFLSAILIPFGIWLFNRKKSVTK